MFSPGFRLFFGFTLAGLVFTFVYGVASNPGGSTDYFGFIDAEAWIGALSLGWKGGVGEQLGYIILFMFALSAGVIAVMLVAFRDADADAVAELAGGEVPPPQPQTPGSYWPAIGAFGVGVVIVGLVTNSAIFIIGLLILAVTAFEWMTAAWADRATGDPTANRELRDRIMKPIETPVIGMIGIVALVLAASRVFLAVSAEWAVWIATAAAAVIFLTAVAFAMVDNINKNIVAGVVAVGAIAALAGGVVAASVGEREFHHPDADGENSDTGGGHAEEGALG